MTWTTGTKSGPSGVSTARARRLMLVSTNMGMGGGAEEQVVRLAYAFDDRGWAVRIVSLVPPSPMPADFQGRGIPLSDLGMRPSVPDPRGVVRLAREVSAFRPDVVHAHMVHANLLARAVRLVRPFPVLVCTHHSQTMAGVHRDRTRLFELAHRLTDPLADASTAISRSAAEYYVGRRAVPASKMRVVPNGIDAGRYAHDPAARVRLRAELDLEGRFVWLAVGRLERPKGYPVLLRALASLGDGGRVLLVCGQGTLRQALEDQADGLGLADRVRFLGLRSDVPALMSAADGFALSSEVEGLPLVLLQAGAAGLPVVATNVGGNAEVVSDGQSGLIVPPDDPAAFARAMARVEAMPARDRAAMGAAGLARIVDRFDFEHVADEWEGLYLDLLRRGAGHREGRRPRSLENTRGTT